MNVLSLFDGMSCGQIALNRLDIKYDNYFASEIKKFAIKVTQHNYPNTIQIGDVTKVSYKDETLKTENGEFKVDKIDLILAGSPCQDFTRMKKGEDNTGYYGEKSKLFFEFVRLLEETKATYFLLENVIMKPEYEKVISEILKVRPIEICSSDFSFQTRQRIYWTNIPVDEIKKKHIKFYENQSKDQEYCKQFKIPKTNNYTKMCNRQGADRTFQNTVGCLITTMDTRHPYGVVQFEDFYRFLTTEELEKAQTVPVGYTSCLSKSQANNVLGDGWTVDVVCHLLKNLKESDCSPINNTYLKESCSLEDFFK